MSNTDREGTSTARFDYQVYETKVAQKIETSRALAGISMRAFCVEVGINRVTWRKVCQGDSALRLAYVYSAAKVLECQVQDFL